jgi:hypothetical protein
MIFQFFKGNPRARLRIHYDNRACGCNDGSLVISVRMIERREVAFSPRCV